jgi:hypothetical protein
VRAIASLPVEVLSSATVLQIETAARTTATRTTTELWRRWIGYCHSTGYSTGPFLAEQSDNERNLYIKAFFQCCRHSTWTIGGGLGVQRKQLGVGLCASSRKQPGYGVSTLSPVKPLARHGKHPPATVRKVASQGLPERRPLEATTESHHLETAARKVPARRVCLLKQETQLSRSWQRAPSWGSSARCGLVRTRLPQTQDARKDLAGVVFVRTSTTRSSPPLPSPECSLTRGGLKHERYLRNLGQVETAHFLARYVKSKLYYPDESLGSHILISLPQVIVHRIDATSPLEPKSVWYNKHAQAHEKSETIDNIEAYLRDRDIEIIVQVEDRRIDRTNSSRTIAHSHAVNSKGFLPLSKGFLPLREKIISLVDLID